MSDEPAAGDVEMLDLRHVRLRAERSPEGSGRTYTLTYRATDRTGSVTSASVTAVVPHDRGWVRR